MLQCYAVECYYLSVYLLADCRMLMNFRIDGGAGSSFPGQGGEGRHYRLANVKLYHYCDIYSLPYRQGIIVLPQQIIGFFNSKTNNA